MKNAIVCNTPLQMMNALNIVVNDVENSKNSTDLFVITNFRDGDNICDRINTLNLFNNIYRFKSNNKNCDSFLKLLDYRKILEIYDYDDNSFLNNAYNNLFVGDKNLLGVAINYKNKCDSVFIYDDGIDSYKGNSIINIKNYKYPVLNKLFKTDVLSYNIKKLYVNNKEYCKSTISKNVEQLPLINDKNPVFEILLNVFDYNSDTCTNKYREIILEQPLSHKHNYNGVTFKSILDDLKEDISSPLIRLHPVQKDLNYDGYMVDNVNNLWELECIKEINENQILMSFYSSAQFAPKFFANKEPYVIFMYKLFLTDYNIEEYIKFEELISVLKNSYKNSNRIFVPESVEELRKIIKSI